MFNASDAPVKGRMLETPELCRENPDLLAITADGKVNGSAVVNLKTGGLTRFGPGCEITFMPGCGKVIWMENGGRRKTRIMISDLARPTMQTLLDLPGEFSHEYFPAHPAAGAGWCSAPPAGGTSTTSPITRYSCGVWAMIPKRRCGSPETRATTAGRTYTWKNENPAARSGRVTAF